jgi:hypothetical protein
VFGAQDKYAVEISENPFKLPQIRIEDKSQLQLTSLALSGLLAAAAGGLGLWLYELQCVGSGYHESSKEWLDLLNPTDRVSAGQLCPTNNNLISF